MQKRGIMRYVLVVSQANYGHQGAFLAFQFAQCLLAKKHCILQIFFFQAGVMNANGLQSPANDEENLLKHWQDLAQTYHIPLNVCISAGQRRGVVDEESGQSKMCNLAKPFELVGLTAFMQALLQADRVLQF